MDRRRFLAGFCLAPFAPTPPSGPQAVVARPVNAQLIGRGGWRSEVVQFDATRPPPPLVFTAPQPDTYTCLMLTDGRTRWVDYLSPTAVWDGHTVTVAGVAWPPVSRQRPARHDHRLPT